MACSSHWWHAPIYFSMSMVLAIIAITSSSPSSSSSSSPSTTTLSPNHTISLNATTALKTHGFSILATLLQVSPDLFLSPPSPHSTIFAIQDDSLSNLSLHPSAMKLLLQYHTLPSKFSLQELLLKPLNSCLPTSIPSKNLTITQIDPKNRLIEINNVSLSHPDLFLDTSLSIHGVLAPFSLHSIPPCNFTKQPVSDFEWVRMMIRVLSSNGFVSFAISLNSVVESIIRDYPDLGPVTVFAPSEFAFVGSPDPFLGRIVRYHVLGERFSYSELALLPEKALLKTLLGEQVVEVTRAVNGSDQVLGINGVDVAWPDVFSTKMFVVHGVPRAFDFAARANT